MKVNKIMTKDVGGVVPEATLRQAAHKMKSLGVGLLPVCDGERLVGVITDRDIVIRAVTRGFDPKKSLVKDIMTPKVWWCFADQDIGDASHIMKRKKIRRLLVMNHQKELAGIISLADIAVYSDNKAACEILKEVSMPAQPRRGI